MRLPVRGASKGGPCWRCGLLALFFFAASAVRADEPVRVLIIDGNGAAGVKKGGDAYHVEAVLSAVKGYAPVIKDAAELEKTDLKKYRLIFLLNVPELSEPARSNLEGHVKTGGGAAFYLGDKVKAGHYNRLLYRKGDGLFPVALPNRPTEAPEEKQKDKEKADQLRAGRPTVYVRDPRHPVCADLVEARDFLAFLSIERYYPMMRGKGAAADRVQALIAFPNESDLDDFKSVAQKLNRALPVAEERFKDFRAGLERHQWAVRRALIFGKKAWELGDALDALLEDRGDPKDSDKPDMTAFWRMAELKELRRKIVELRDKSRYANPLVVAAPFGMGRVVVCLTSAGESWNDWASGPAAPAFVLLTASMAKYLTRGGGDRP